MYGHTRSHHHVLPCLPQNGKISFSDMMASEGGRMVLLGVLVCLAGIVICGKAGMMKEKDLPDDVRRKSIAEFSLVKGLIVATISGILRKSEEHTSELQSLMRISYAVFCLKKKK